MIGTLCLWTKLIPQHPVEFPVAEATHRNGKRTEPIAGRLPKYQSINNEKDV